MKRTDWQMFRDVREAMGPEPYHTDPETDCRVSPNVGDMMAGALAAAGAYARELAIERKEWFNH